MDIERELVGEEPENILCIEITKRPPLPGRRDIFEATAIYREKAITKTSVGEYSPMLAFGACIERALLVIPKGEFIVTMRLVN